MRVAVISDIHGNLHALEAVLAAIDEQPPDALWCLGDLVGYGPRPNPCCSKAAARADVCLAGNHDLGVLDERLLGDFTPDAAASAFWTREVLGGEERGFLESLAPSAILDDAGAELYHASPRDPVWEYVLDAVSMRAALEDTNAPIVLVGHTHVPLCVSLDGDRVHAQHAPDGTEADFSSTRLLLNPGSVGQPRDGDPRAAFLLLDLDARTASFRRVDYPIEQTQAEIHERGLPDSLAERLTHGI